MRSAFVLVACLTLTAGHADAQRRPDAARSGRPATSGVEAVARAVEVDHVFLATRPGAPEAAALRAAVRGLHRQRQRELAGRARPLAPRL